MSMSIFTELTAVVVLASFLGILARRFGQPTLLAYLVAGAVAGSAGFFALAENREVFELFSDLGVMFLLFLVGLEMNYASLRSVGRDALVVGLGQVIFTFILGFLIALWFDFAPLVAFYIAFALTISSTVVVVSALSERKDLNTLHGKIIVGILLVQDVIVIVALVLLSGAGELGTETVFSAKIVGAIALSLLKGSAIFLVAFLLGRTLIPKFFDEMTRSPDLVFLSGLAWLFAVTSLVDYFGFSKEIGGLLAGVGLADSYEKF